MNEVPLDPVSNFQEIVQKRTKSLPDIEVSRIDGNDHNPIFEATIKVLDMNIKQSGTGNSKKEAVKNACVKAIDALNAIS